MARRELARFLRDRREGLRPVDVGLPAGNCRRTPGLRREEVAELAVISVDYYVRLEQARGPHPSTRVLESLAGALRLTTAERGHLFRLADTVPAPPPGPTRAVRPYVAGLLDRMDAAAVVTDATYTVVAANPLAGALLGGLGDEPNLARRRFLGRNACVSTGAEEFGEIAVARLRSAADRYPHDPGLASLLAQLRAGGPEFEEIWERNPVRAPGHREKTLEHPLVGNLLINCDVLTVPDDDQQVVFMTADAGSRSARGLARLAELTRAPAERIA